MTMMTMTTRMIESFLSLPSSSFVQLPSRTDYGRMDNHYITQLLISFIAQPTQRVTFHFLVSRSTAPVLIEHKSVAQNKTGVVVVDISITVTITVTVLILMAYHS